MLTQSRQQVYCNAHDGTLLEQLYLIPYPGVGNFRLQRDFILLKKVKSRQI